MKFEWSSTGYVHACRFETPVRVMMHFNGKPITNNTTNDVGYITRHPLKKGYWIANVYGSINYTSPSLETNDLDEAKRYVEQQAIVGVVMSRLS
jgi:hypothetical protein